MLRHLRRAVAKKPCLAPTQLSIEALEDRAMPAAFTPGDLVIYRVGTGGLVDNLTAAATAVFLDEYTPGGVLVQTLPMPTVDSGANQTLTASGTATSEGLLTRSTDGRYLVLTGYDAPLRTGNVAS